MSRGGLRSVRARVSVACAAVAFVLVLVLTVLIVAVLSRREYAELDRRLATASEALVPAVAEDFPLGLDEAIDSPRSRLLLRVLAPGLIAAVGQDGIAIGTTSVGETVADDAVGLPVVPLGPRTVTLAGADYRLLTVPVAGVRGATLTVAVPVELAAAPVRAIRLWGLVIGGLAALVGGALGWLAAGVAVRPLRQLRDRTRAVDGRGPMPSRAELTAGSPGTAAETEDLADAIAGLLDRVQTARAGTERALQNARDFAAAADHELRTPLTTIQTDLDVLLAHPDLGAEQRREILDEVVGAQRRMLDTLQALRALADGDVAANAGMHATTVDVAEVVRRAVDAAGPKAAGAAMSLDLPAEDALVMGSPAGLRLAVENLVANALRHAHADRVEVSVLRRDGRVVVRVDDDGTGLPIAEREKVFGRFARGTNAVGAGSGLGLALVAQQADLHGGMARLTDSSLGGLRAELDLPAAPENAG